MDEKEREDGNNLMIHSWVGWWGQPILQIKMIDEFLITWRWLLDPILEHGTFINSLTELLKTKMKFVSLLVKIKDSSKAKCDVTKEIQMFSWPKHGLFRFSNAHAPNGPLRDPGTLLLLQTGSLKTTYPQDFKDPGDGKASGRVQTCVNVDVPLSFRSYINQLAGSHSSLLQVCLQMSGHWSILQL